MPIVDPFAQGSIVDPFEKPPEVVNTRFAGKQGFNSDLPGEFEHGKPGLDKLPKLQDPWKPDFPGAASPRFMRFSASPASGMYWAGSGAALFAGAETTGVGTVGTAAGLLASS